MTTFPQQSHPPRLGFRQGGFITLSLAAHWLVLAGWTTPESTSIPATAIPLNVKLSPLPPGESTTLQQTKVENQPTSLPAKSAIKQAMATTRETAPSHAEPTMSTAETASTVAWVESPIRPGETELLQIQPKTIPLAEAQEGIRNSLKDDLARHFKYPHLARLRNWEGTVLLELQIETDGKISRVTLAQSSGYALLDDNAITTLNRIGNVNGAQQWLVGGNMELQLSVVYRLSDS